MWQWYTPLPLIALMVCFPFSSDFDAFSDQAPLPADVVFSLGARTEARFELEQPADEQMVRICDLHPGHQYRLWVVAPREAAFAGRLMLKKQSAPTGMLPGNQPSGKWWGNYHKFVAEGEFLEVEVRGQADVLQGRPLFVSIQCTDCAGGAHFGKHGDQPELPNLSVSSQSPSYLIQNVLVGGGCFSVSGITPIGPSAGRGEFFNGLSSVGFDHGVILESGSINNAPGPNNSNSAGNDMGGGSDPDLNILGAGQVFDAVGIEFDFTPTIDTVTFNYVFASEEYCEYVNSSYNDVFGFFISGPGISGGFTSNGANIALVPGTGQFVAINTVNHLQNQAYFNPNQGNCGGTTNMTDIEFDGYTTILSATAVVIPCSTYHIRLVVGDVGDGIYDSAVFLEANSFTPGNAVSANVLTLAGTSGSTATVYEGCTGNFIIFERQNGDNSQPVDVTYTISSSSTATPGADYDPLPTTVTIPAGQDTIMVPFTTFADGIPEGVETVIIELDNPCTCSSNMVTIQIEDVNLQVSMPDVTDCGANPVTLTPTVSGGPEPYTYNWSTGATTPTITVAPTPGVPTTYTVTVTDACGNTETASATVTLDPPPTATLSGNGTVCGTGTTSVDVTVNFTGNGPWVFVYTVDGVAQAPVTTSSNPYTFTVNGVTAGTVIGLLSVDYANNSCPGAVTGSVTITQVDLQVSATPTDVQCAGASDGQISVSVSGGSGNYTYQWSGGLPGVANPTGVPPGTYTVIVTDVDQNCDGTATVTINEPPPLSVSVTTTPANCNGGGSATVTASGGMPGYTYTWSGGISGANPTGMPSGTYELTVTDANGCTQTTSVTIGEDVTPPTAAASANGTITCANPELTLSGAGSSTGSNFTYQWSGPGIVSGGNTLNPTVNAGGTYTITVTNTDNGCTATASVTVPENTTPPVATASGGTVTCYNPIITISGAGSSTGSQYTYQWSGPGIVSGANTLNPTVNAGGTYTLTVTDTNNGCTATATVTVFENTTPPQANATAPDITCANPEVTISGAGSSVGANFTYQWTGPGIVSGANGLFPTVNQPGTYTLTVTNTVNGCTATASVTVTENTTPPVAVILPPAPLNCTTSTVTLSGNGSSTGHHSYQWSGPGIVSGANTLNPTVDAPGTYTLVVTDNVNGCTASASVTVVDNSDPPTAVANASNNIDCAHATATLFSSGSTTGPGIQYTWTGPGIISGQNSPTAVVNQAGTYVLSVYNSNNGCSSSAAVVVTGDATPPTVQIAQPPPFTCQFGWVTLQAAGTSSGPEFTYNWTTTDGIILTGQGTLTPLAGAPGTYVLEVTNTANGCVAADSVTVVADTTAPVADAGPPQVLDCATPQVTLQGSATGGSGAPQFQWSGPGIVSGAQSATPVVDQPGTYTLVVTSSANGCSDTASVTVTEDYQLPTAVIAAPGTLNCQDTTLVLDATGSSQGPGIAYTWTTTDGLILSGANTLTPVIGAPGTYVLSVFNAANQCSNSAAVTVQAAYNYPTVDAGPDMAITCTATEVTLDGTASQVGPGVLIQWSSPSGNIVSGAQTLTPVVNEPGTYILTLTDTLTACSASDEVVVTVDASVPMADAGPNLTFNCLSGTTLTIDATGSSAGPDFSYAWTTADGHIVSGDSTLTPVVDAPGTYELVVTNLTNGCTAFSAVTVSEDYTAPAPSVSVSGIINCQESTVWLDASASANADAYAWTTPDGLILSDAALPQIEVAGSGTYVVTLTNGATGCSATDTVFVDEDFTTPAAVIASSAPITCAQGVVTLDASASTIDSLTSVTWSTADGHIASGDSTLTPSVDAAGQYTLLLVHELSGCLSTTSVTVGEDLTAPLAEAGPPLTLDCTVPQEALQGQAPAGALVWWTTADGHIASGDSTLNPVVGAGGTYVLHVLDPGNGCSATDTVEVVHTGALPQIAIEPPLTLTCALTEVVLDASASDDDSGLVIQWQTDDGHFVAGTQSLTPTVDAAGTYTLTISNPANGCVSTQSVTVAIDTAAPQLAIAPPALMGCNMATQQLEATASGASANTVHQWTTADGTILSGATTLQPVVGSGGTYVLTAFNPANGCESTAAVTVVQDLTTPQVELGPEQVFTCATDSLVAQAQVSGHPDHLQFSWQTADGLLLAQQGPVAHLGAAGTYVLQVVDTVNFCESTDTLLVLADDNLPPVAIAAPAPITCASPQVLLDGAGSAAGPEYSYLWTTTDGLLVGDTTAPTTMAAAPGTYQLTVFNTDNQCVNTATVVVTADTLPPEAGILPPALLTCSQPEQMLSGVVNTPWPYVVEWQAGNGGQIVADAQTLTPLVDSPGTYTMTVTHTGNGCSTTVSVDVAGDFDQPVPQVAPPATLTCLVTTTTLDASASFGDSLAFEWTTDDGLLLAGAQSPLATAGAPGTYWLTLTDQTNGCSQTTSVVVQQDVTPPEAQAQAAGAITCAQSAVTLTSAGSSSGPQFTYQWTTQDGLILSGGQQTVATAGAAGTYQLQVTNTQNGCTATAEVSVAIDTVAPPLTLAAPGMLTCAQPQVSLSANTTLPDGTWTVQWTTPDGHIVGSDQQPVVTVDAGGTYVAQITSLDNGCSSTASAVVQVDTLSPQVSLSANGALTCTQDAVLLTAALDAPPPATTVQWTGPDGQPLTVSGLSFEATQPGSYQIAITNQANGCTGTAIAVVEDARVYPQIALASSQPLTCLIDQVTLEAQVQPATGLDPVLWTTPDGHLVSGEQTLTPVVDAPGTYQLSVTHAASGCTSTASVQVTEDRTPPQVDAGPDKLIDCHVQEVVLEGTATGTQIQVTWTTPDGHFVTDIATLTPAVDAPGTYVLQVTDLANGCAGEDEVVVTRSVPEEMLVEVIDPLCHGMTGAISILEVEGGAPPYSYSLDGEDFTPNPVFTGVPPGEYAVLALDANGCIVSDTVELIEPEAIDLWIDSIDVLQFGDSLLLEAKTNLRPNQIATIQWTPVEGLSCDTCLVTWAKPFESNWYSILLVDLNGCSAEETVFLRVDKRPAIYVPNAFSPNGDGNNDRFYIFAKPGVVREIREFLVFDRWGEAVYRYEHFQPNDPATGWDGTHRGQPMDPQVLVWYAIVELEDGRVVTLKGDVTLVR